LIETLEYTPHGKNFKNCFQIDLARTKRLRRCICFKMNFVAKEELFKLQKDNEELKKEIIKMRNEFAKMQSLSQTLINEV
jgi:hypothetical protein